MSVNFRKRKTPKITKGYHLKGQKMSSVESSRRRLSKVKPARQDKQLSELLMLEFEFETADMEMPRDDVQDSLRSSTRSTEESLFHSIVTPTGVHAEHWICANTCDFIDDLHALYVTCQEDHCSNFTKPGEGFPKGVQYRWEGEEVNGATYVDQVFHWLVSLVEDPTVFVDEIEVDNFPEDFKGIISKMFTRMLRIFAILLRVENEFFQQWSKVQYTKLIQEFQRFVFFAEYWKLLDFEENQDAKPLKSVISQIRNRYIIEQPEWERKTLKRYREDALLRKQVFLEKYGDCDMYRATPVYVEEFFTFIEERDEE